MKKSMTPVQISNEQMIGSDDYSVININHFHVPTRKEFLTINELAEQIPFGRTKIIEMIKSGELKEEIHFRIIGKKYIFYFPMIISLFKPKLAEEKL